MRASHLFICAGEKYDKWTREVLAASQQWKFPQWNGDARGDAKRWYIIVRLVTRVFLFSLSSHTRCLFVPSDWQVAGADSTDCLRCLRCLRCQLEVLRQFARTIRQSGCESDWWTPRRRLYNSLYFVRRLFDVLFRTPFGEKWRTWVPVLFFKNEKRKIWTVNMKNKRWFSKMLVNYNRKFGFEILNFKNLNF